MVQEGEIVEQGQTLAFLDSYDERRAERDHATAKLAEAERLLAAERAVGASRVEAAEIRLRRAGAIYPLRIEAQKARLRRIEAELANNRDILKTRSKLKLNEFNSRRSVDDQLTIVRQSEEDLVTARTEVKRLESEYEIDIREARNARIQAEADLESASATIGIEALRAGTTGRRNTFSLTGLQALVQSFGGSSPSEGFAGPCIERVSNNCEYVRTVCAQIGSFREVLSKQSIGVLVRSALPRAVRFAEVDGKAGCDPQIRMPGHLCSLVSERRSCAGNVVIVRAMASRTASAP